MFHWLFGISFYNHINLGHLVPEGNVGCKYPYFSLGLSIGLGPDRDRISPKAEISRTGPNQSVCRSDPTEWESYKYVKRVVKSVMLNLCNGSQPKIVNSVHSRHVMHTKMLSDSVCLFIETVLDSLDIEVKIFCYMFIIYGHICDIVMHPVQFCRVRNTEITC